MLLDRVISKKGLILSVFIALATSFTACTSDEHALETPVSTSPGANANEAAKAPSAESKTGSFSPETVYFGFDSANLDSSSQEKLTRLSDHLKSSNTTVQIAGHTCDIGTPEYNLALGARRAESAKNFLVQLGVDVAHLSTISYGEEKPAAEGHSEEARAKNRRAEPALLQ
ncbi:MAG: OmpA family protein [Oligoflexales bacterium]|nr:OmpA family protein [Oligoflexales bacterium]